MEYNMIENGERLIALRGKRKREEVAVAAGISSSSLTMYELGQRNPRDEVKLALASFFGVSVSDIFFPNEVHTE